MYLKIFIILRHQKKIEITTVLRSHFTPVRIAVIKKSISNAYDLKTRRHLYTYMVNFMKISIEGFKTPKVEPSYDIALLLLALKYKSAYHKIFPYPYLLLCCSQ